MSRFGKYNPVESENTSTLFSYGETPLASSKLNQWNGNIEASLNWLTQCAAILFGGRDDDFVLDEGRGDELQVKAQELPSLSVRVLPGRALTGRCFAGLDNEKTVPDAADIEIPMSHPRWDIVCLDVYGTPDLVKGQEAASPELPALPQDCVALAKLFLRPSMSYVCNSDDGINGYIEDCRPSYLCGRATRGNEDPGPPETPDGTRTQFSTSMKFVPGSLDVYVNGLLQAKSGVYAEDSERRSYTFLTAPPQGYAIQHRYRVQCE